jgi:Na+-driven multidrug efflux pump
MINFHQNLINGTGKLMSLITRAILRNMILVIIFTYILAIPLNMGERGVWWEL